MMNVKIKYKNGKTEIIKSVGSVNWKEGWLTVEINPSLNTILINKDLIARVIF